MLKSVLKCAHRRYCFVPLFVCVLVVATAALSAAPAMANRDSVAVIIGNWDYSAVKTHNVEFARNDAAAMKAFVVDRLGYDPANVIYKENATLGTFYELFGTKGNPQGKVWNWARSGRSNVFIYYSGHGAPDTRTEEAYLIPTDIDPERAANGYSMALLDDNLKKLKAYLGPSSDVVLMLDACFSGRSDRGTVVSVSAGLIPRVPAFGPGIIRLDAAQATQVATWDKRRQLGLFTSVFLSGVSGAADAKPSGNGDGRIVWAELARFVDDEVRYRSRRARALEQVPNIPTHGPSWTFEAGETPSEARARACREEPGRWRELKAAGDLTAAKQALASFSCPAVVAAARPWIAQEEEKLARAQAEKSARQRALDEELRKIREAREELERQQREFRERQQAQREAERKRIADLQRRPQQPLKSQHSYQHSPRRSSGSTSYVDPVTGVGVDLPGWLARRGQSRSYGRNYSSSRSGDGIQVDTLRFHGGNCLTQRMGNIRRSKKRRPSSYVLRSSYGEISGRERSEWYWVRMEKRGNECRGLSIVVSTRASQFRSMMSALRRSAVMFP